MLDITETGTSLTLLNEDGSLNPNFTVNSPLKLADLGSDVTIALRQELSDSSLTGDSMPENVFGDVDSVVVTSIPEPGSLILFCLGAIVLALGPWTPRRRC